MKCFIRFCCGNYFDVLHSIKKSNNISVIIHEDSDDEDL